MIPRRDFLAAALAATAVQTALPAAAQTRRQPEYGLHPKLMPQTVRVKPDLEPQQIVVLPKSHFLYYVTEPGRALRYGVGVGRAGLEFTGTAVIEVKKEWPTWRPTDEMIERDPEEYDRFKDNDYVQPGGPSNPLGARALYLFENGRDTFYRIHGTNAPRSIGTSVSNGCIRMLNDHVIDLYERVPIGTKVTVIM
ncbi:MAG: L,D-transpeptidase [Paracoccaceae bacterium]